MLNRKYISFAGYSKLVKRNRGLAGAEQQDLRATRRCGLMFRTAKQEEGLKTSSLRLKMEFRRVIRGVRPAETVEIEMLTR